MGITHDITKTALYLSAACAAGMAEAFPTIAMASDKMDSFGAGDIIDQMTSGDEMHADKYETANTSTFVRRVATWLLGLGVSLLVLKIAITGVDRILFGEKNAHPMVDKVGNTIYIKGTPLEDIPVIGAYPIKDDKGNGYTWADIWLIFAKNLAMILGAWLFVQAISGIVVMVFSAADGSLATT